MEFNSIISKFCVSDKKQNTVFKKETEETE